MGSEAKIREWGVLIGWCPLDCYDYYRVSKNWVLSPPSKDEGMLPFSIPILVYHPPSTIQCISSLVQNLFVCTLSIGFPRYIVPKGGAASPTPPPPPPIYFEFFRTIASSDLIWPFLISILISTLVLQLLLQPQTLKSTTAATMVGGPKTFFEDYCSTFFLLLHNLKGTTILLSTTPSFQLVIHFSISHLSTPKWTTTNPTTPYFPFIFRPPVAPPHLLFRFQRSLATFFWKHLNNFNLKEIMYLHLWFGCDCMSFVVALHNFTVCTHTFKKLRFNELTGECVGFA